MRIAVNTRLLLKNRLDGMGWFSYESLKRITRAHPEHEFIFLFDRKFDEEFIFSDNIKPVVIHPQSRHPVLWFLWLEGGVHRFLKKNDVDLFVSPDGFIPLHSKVPCISVVHDINFYHRPKDLPLTSRLYYNYFFPQFVKRSNRVATVSEYSARDIVENYEVERKKIDVVYNGVNENFGVISQKEVDEVRKKLSGGDPYFIFIGSLHPRKNVPNLLKAYDLFRKKSNSRTKLLIVGEKFFLTSAIENVISDMEYASDVVFTGRLNAGELHKVLAASLALTFIPYYEGFGIPVVEAMKCGVPVLASNVTSLPEVGGDAVLYAGPENIQEVAERMITLSGNTQKRTELIKMGHERVKQFSWDKTAERFWNCIEKVLNET